MIKVITQNLLLSQCIHIIHWLNLSKDIFKHFDSMYFLYTNKDLINTLNYSDLKREFRIFIKDDIALNSIIISFLYLLANHVYHFKNKDKDSLLKITRMILYIYNLYNDIMIIDQTDNDTEPVCFLKLCLYCNQMFYINNKLDKIN